MSNSIDLSVVIPVFNEEENIPKLIDALNKVLKKLDKSYEVIFIDDGSTDNSFKVLKDLIPNPNFKVIRFRRNFGQTAAISAGFDYSRGSVIVTMDGDLQNDPEDIPKLLAKIYSGYDIVSGWREKRNDPLSKRLPSKISNKLASLLTGVELHDYGCTLKAYRCEIVKNMHLYGEMHRYIPAIASWIGIKVTEIKVKHHARKYGKSKYGVSRLMKGFLDLITVKFLLSYSTRPMQLFGIAGVISTFIGFVIGAYLSIGKLFFGMGLADRPLLLLAVLLVFLGIQFITMGLLGELVVRTYYEVQNKPRYVVREIVE